MSFPASSSHRCRMAVSAIGANRSFLTIGNVQLEASCIQTDGSGGYVVSTAQLNPATERPS